MPMYKKNETNSVTVKSYVLKIFKKSMRKKVVINVISVETNVYIE